MQELKANTAVDVLIGPFLDSLNGDDEEVALVLARATILLSKNGQALTQKANTITATYDAKGCYNCELGDTDTDTEGSLVLLVHEAGALIARHDFMVLSEAAYDSKYAANDTGFMKVDTVSILGDGNAAGKLALSSGLILNGAVTATLTGNQIFSTNLGATITQDNALNGSVLIFTLSTLTTALKRVPRTITSYSAATGEVTLDAPLPASTQNSDVFVVV